VLRKPIRLAAFASSRGEGYIFDGAMTVPSSVAPALMSPHPSTTLPAIRTRVDFSLVHALRARRLAREPDPASKLALLRRLCEQAVFRSLPESPSEPSGNEQLFARVLGYHTLSSRSALPFHLLPRSFADRDRAADFSLGFFGTGADVVLGTAELESPGVGLDAPRSGDPYEGRTPVTQALEAAVAHGARCRWALVSNFCELRLYDAHDPWEPLAVVKDLAAVRNPDDLALLGAHFDVAALLGSAGKDDADMAAALDTDHLSHPLPARPAHARLVLRFVRKEPLTLALFQVEKALRHAGEVAGETLGVPSPAREWQLVAGDGWVSVEPLPTVRLSASRFGEVQLSMAIPTPWDVVPLDGEAQTLARIAVAALHEAALGFCNAVAAFHRTNLGGDGFAGTTSGELREVKDVVLFVENLREPLAPKTGACPTADISAGDFACAGPLPSCLASPLASLLCELAIQFRASHGGVGLSHRDVSSWLERRLSPA
jgi:hypothetical protein